MTCPTTIKSGLVIVGLAANKEASVMPNLMVAMLNNPSPGTTVYDDTLPFEQVAVTTGAGPVGAGVGVDGVTSQSGPGIAITSPIKIKFGSVIPGLT